MTRSVNALRRGVEVGQHMLIKADAIWAALLQVGGGRPFDLKIFLFGPHSLPYLPYLISSDIFSWLNSKALVPQEIYIAREAEKKITAAWERHLFANTNWDHLFQIFS